MENVFISIIVPVYNSERYLSRCIESLMCQTFKDLEIILINDGSKDKSLEILNNYATLDKRIKVINKDNGGVSSARNAGIKCAKGKYISFVDSDDWCEIDMFSNMALIAKEHDIDFINIGYSMDNENGKPVKYDVSKKLFIGYSNSEISTIMSRITLGYSVMKLYKRHLIVNQEIYFNEELSLGEDAIFVQDYVKYINSIADIDRIGYHYVRCNSESLSTKYVKNINEFIEQFWIKEQFIIDRFPEYGDLRKDQGNTRYINGTMLYIYNNYKKGSPYKATERREDIKRFMNDLNVRSSIENYKPHNSKHKIFVFLYRLNSPFVMDTVFSARSIIVKILGYFTGIKK